MPRDQHLCMTIHSSEREERVCFFEATPVKESLKKIDTKKLHRKVTNVTMIYHLHSCREIKDYRFLFDRCDTLQARSTAFYDVFGECMPFMVLNYEASLYFALPCH